MAEALNGTFQAEPIGISRLTGLEFLAPCPQDWRDTRPLRPAPLIIRTP
jgi:hypothetical protein